MKRVAENAEFRDKLSTALFGLSRSDKASLLSRIAKSYNYHFQPEDVPVTFLEDLDLEGQLTDRQLGKFAGSIQIFTAK